MLHRILRGLTVAGLLLPLLIGGGAGAQTQVGMTEVGAGRTVEIVAHGVCRRVRNNNALNAMVPHGTSAEWVTGSASSFLSNVPPNMVATGCVSPEIAIREWSRPGPAGSNLQPFLVMGADHGLTLTSIGAPTRGGTAALSVPLNRITYTPPSAFWGTGYLDEEEDTVPFEAIDAEGVPVTGTLRVRLVGFREGVQFRALRYYNPSSPLDIVGNKFENLDPETGTNNILNSIYFFNEVTFDGQLFIHGIMNISDNLGHVILIDNSPAANTTYAGGTVGNLNGDGLSNTILDAQLRAARDFVDLLISEAEARRTCSSVTEGVVSASVFGVDNGTNNLVGLVRIYAVNSGLTYVGDVTGGTAAEVRSSANALLAGVQRTSNTLQIRNVLTALGGEMPTIVSNQFSVAVHLLSPGVNAGGAPTNLPKFNDAGTGNFGTPLFAFYTGGNAASAEATFMTGLDREGRTRHLSSTAVFGAFNYPNPLNVAAVPLYWNGSGANFMRRADNSVIFQFGQPVAGQKSRYRFSFRILPSTDQTCYRGAGQCVAQELAPVVLTGFTGINPAFGVKNEIQLQVEMVRNPIYRVHHDRRASSFNDSGALVLRDGSDIVEGQFRATPP